MTLRGAQDPAGTGKLFHVGLLALLAFTPAVSLAMPGTGEVAVIGAPGRDVPHMTQMIASAGGSVVRAGRWSNIMIAVSSEPGFTARLYREGAWLVLDPLIVAGCVAPNAKVDP